MKSNKRKNRRFLPIFLILTMLAVMLATGCSGKLPITDQTVTAADAAVTKGAGETRDAGGKKKEPTESTAEKEKAAKASTESSQSTKKPEPKSELKGTKADSNIKHTMPAMEVHFIDVGQADCILIELDGHAMLVDSGNNADAAVITAYLDGQGIKKLDYVIGTHPHEDHIGSLDTVILTYDIGEVILPDKIHSSLTFEDVLDALDKKDLLFTPADPGDTYDLGGASFTILSPNKDYGDNLNNWSAGIRLVYGNTSFVLTGDAEQEAEQDIVNTGLTLSADVYKAAHHGSETSNSQAFLKAVSPSAAVISCGKDNQYGHPDESVLKEFREMGIDVYRTDEQGTIIAVSDGESITFSADPDTSMKPGNGKADKKGSSDNDENPVKPAPTKAPEKETKTELTVHITKTGSKYHSAGCSYLKKSDIEVSLEDALALGLTPCSRCNPPK